MVLELRASLRLQILWLAWCLALAVALVAGTGVGWWLRIGATVGCFWLGSRGLSALRRPGRALRRLSWGSDGRWQAQDAFGNLAYVALTAPPQSFGPLYWLRLQASDWRETVLIDTADVEPQVLATLKARLRLDRPAKRS